MTIYQKKVTLETDFSPMSVRGLLNHWLIPQKMQHFLRVDQNILVNGQYRAFNRFVEPGDQIDMTFSDVSVKTQEYDLDQAQLFTVLYEDADLLVVNKPAGIKTHPNRPHENGTLMNQVATYLAAQGKHAYMVHRIDLATSGAVMIGKTPIVIGILNRQLSQKTMARQYIAVVNDPQQLLLDHDTINFPIGIDPDNQRKRQADYINGLSAITHYQLLTRQNDTATLAVNLETGRTHQIRVHLAGIDHPILGDPLYNPSDTTSRLLLHGQTLRYTEPFTDHQRTVIAPLPTAFDPYLNQPQ
ncbi:RluA family pseudouridine synthase [Latilactobacillus fuchuensis]|uniref:RNA pseudouridylate synthase n=2 Tax=Latilactobacillus fuchuensis TaxID=164393 RepID=A0A2N9DUE9_9LACO|nr:RluA family pseudouridine synthase [Latilactobacillus fuchuensis]KRL61597.1 rluA1 protein [Latilactobacillus fuchuensis DSM 14340 = JCM 11249]MCP8857620.1 RluA family pseudouridine synthase [Latilactobacillus fuchuensis]SPC37635.1 Pseudouridine synthase [Latilactobacillus fuchuensis]